jgi:hypothetical protein
MPPPHALSPQIAPGPFLPTVAAPIRPAAPRPAVDVSALRPPTATPDAAPLPAWKQQRTRGPLGRAVKWFVVACIVCGVVGGVVALVNQPDDSELPAAQMQPTDSVAARLPGQQAIDDARVVVGQTNGVVTADGRVTFVTEQSVLDREEAVDPTDGTVNATSYTVQATDDVAVSVLVVHAPASLTSAPQSTADAIANGAASDAHMSITSTRVLPVLAGNAFVYVMSGTGLTMHLRVLVADDTAVMVAGATIDGSVPVQLDAIWRTVTFDGVSIV